MKKQIESIVSVPKNTIIEPPTPIDFPKSSSTLLPPEKYEVGVGEELNVNKWAKFKPLSAKRLVPHNEIER